jgi:hypothetical protein
MHAYVERRAVVNCEAGSARSLNSDRTRTNCQQCIHNSPYLFVSRVRGACTSAWEAFSLLVHGKIVNKDSKALLHRSSVSADAPVERKSLGNTQRATSPAEQWEPDTAMHEQEPTPEHSKPDPSPACEPRVTDEFCALEPATVPPMPGSNGGTAPAVAAAQPSKRDPSLTEQQSTAEQRSKSVQQSPPEQHSTPGQQSTPRQECTPGESHAATDISREVADVMQPSAMSMSAQESHRDVAQEAQVLDAAAQHLNGAKTAEVLASYEPDTSESPEQQPSALAHSDPLNPPGTNATPSETTRVSASAGAATAQLGVDVDPHPPDEEAAECAAPDVCETEDSQGRQHPVSTLDGSLLPGSASQRSVDVEPVQGLQVVLNPLQVCTPMTSGIHGHDATLKASTAQQQSPVSRSMVSPRSAHQRRSSIHVRVAREVIASPRNSHSLAGLTGLAMATPAAGQGNCTGQQANTATNSPCRGHSFAIQCPAAKADSEAQSSARSLMHPVTGTPDAEVSALASPRSFFALREGQDVGDGQPVAFLPYEQLPMSGVTACQQRTEVHEDVPSLSVVHPQVFHALPSLTPAPADEQMSCDMMPRSLAAQLPAAPHSVCPQSGCNSVRWPLDTPIMYNQIEDAQGDIPEWSSDGASADENGCDNKVDDEGDLPLADEIGGAVVVDLDQLEPHETPTPLPEAVWAQAAEDAADIELDAGFSLALPENQSTISTPKFCTGVTASHPFAPCTV